MVKKVSRRAKSKTGRLRREEKARGPKLVENPKSLLCLQGKACNEVMQLVLSDIASLCRPRVKTFSRKNDVLPFEDASSLEFFSMKNDCSFVALASHNKKRPNNLVLSRMFDHKILDRLELGVDAYTPMASLEGPKKAIGSKPCLIFQGDAFEHDPTFKVVKNMFLDLFRGRVQEEVALPMVDHSIVITAVDGKVLFRPYYHQFMRSGTKIPKVDLLPMGPNINFVVRRTQFASRELAREARRVPRQAKPTKIKNVGRDGLGSKTGRIHMERQDYDNLQLRKIKALKIMRKRQRGEEGDSDEGGDGVSGPDSDGTSAGAGAGAGSEPESDGEPMERPSKLRRSRRLAA